ncbi:hypothetical protein M413DRAFT_13865 [Hebeloma cylindrosporum]|uniref:DUF6589 domain-containing protein n=1 Tax=Hebeloma cylindrosporum TaxID=76867 RepID=A0A0C2XEX9_HEBCY|nr:hypothetical protein M413DRAFT_13865 [Hebeloma cylindrosporum h7]
MEIDENTINGNIQIIEEINAELKLDPENSEYQKYIKIIAGDQLTIARQRAITAIRLRHEVGLEMWKHFVYTRNASDTLRSIVDTQSWQPRIPQYVPRPTPDCLDILAVFSDLQGPYYGFAVWAASALLAPGVERRFNSELCAELKHGQK